MPVDRTATQNPAELPSRPEDWVKKEFRPEVRTLEIHPLCEKQSDDSRGGEIAASKKKNRSKWLAPGVGGGASQIR